MATGEPPGPSGPPVLGQTLSFVSDPLETVSTVTAAHGPTTRMRVLGLGELYNVTHPTGIEQVLDEKRDAFRRPAGFRTKLGESLFAVEGDQWDRLRSAVEGWFGPDRVRAVADDVGRLTTRRVAQWADGETRSLHEAMQALSLDVLFETLFGRELALDGDEELRRAADDISLWLDPPSAVLPSWVPTPGRRRFHDAVATMREEGRRLLATREREHDRGEAGDDLLATLVAHRADGRVDLSDREIVDQVLGAAIGGYDQTAVLLTAALHHLGTDESVRGRFHEELATVLDDDRPGFADLSALEVTGRIVEETLRACPPIHTVPRVTTRAVEVDGYRLAPDRRVHVGVWEAHHDAERWASPDEWRPGRWRDVSDTGYGYLPFGVGPRSCVAGRVVRLQAKLVLSTLGQAVHLDPVQPLAFEPKTTLQPAHDVPVTVHRR